MPGTTVKAKTSPWLTHTGCFVKQYQSFTPLLLLPEAMNRLLKDEKSYKLVQTTQFTAQFTMLSFKPKDFPSDFPSPLASLLCTTSMAIPTGTPRWWGIFKIFNWWITNLFFFFFHSCTSFDISRSQTALLKMWTCVSWSPLVDSFRRLQTPRKGEKRVALERSTVQSRKGMLSHHLTSKRPSLAALETALPASEKIPAPLQHKWTSLPWTAEVMWTQNWSCSLCWEARPAVRWNETIIELESMQGHSSPI